MSLTRAVTEEKNRTDVTRKTQRRTPRITDEEEWLRDESLNWQHSMAGTVIAGLRHCSINILASSRVVKISRLRLDVTLQTEPGTEEATETKKAVVQ